MPNIEWLLTRSFTMCQMFVLTKALVTYELFDLDIILKVRAAINILNLVDLNGGTNPPQASNQAVFGVFCFASVGSTNMGLIY